MLLDRVYTFFRITGSVFACTWMKA